LGRGEVQWLGLPEPAARSGLDPRYPRRSENVRDRVRCLGRDQPLGLRRGLRAVCLGGRADPGVLARLAPVALVTLGVGRGVQVEPRGRLFYRRAVVLCGVPGPHRAPHPRTGVGRSAIWYLPVHDLTSSPALVAAAIDTSIVASIAIRILFASVI